jgi:hypothetical protein
VPTLATHVPGKPFNPAGRFNVTIPGCATLVAFGTLNEPFTTSPGCVFGNEFVSVSVSDKMNGVTVTVNEHVASGLLTLVSLAVQVTVVAPIAKFEPLAGKHVTVAALQLSVAVGGVNVTGIGNPLEETKDWFAGHAANVGAVVSFTVTVKLHVVSGLFALASLAVHVTVVTPNAKVEPLAGKQVTVAAPQLSVAVGAVN